MTAFLDFIFPGHWFNIKSCVEVLGELLLKEAISAHLVVELSQEFVFSVQLI